MDAVDNPFSACYCKGLSTRITLWISILLLHSTVDTAVAFQSGNPLCLCIFEFLKGDSCLFAKKISIFFAPELQEILQNAAFSAYPPYPQAAHSTVCGYFQRVITGTFGKTCGDSTAFPQVRLWIIPLPAQPAKRSNNPLVNHFFRTSAKEKTLCNLFADA